MSDKSNLKDFKFDTSTYVQIPEVKKMTDKSVMEKVRDISDIESDGPELSCPYIDGVIKRYPDTAATLEYVREINSQLRYDRDGYKTMYLEMKLKDQEWREIVGPLVEALEEIAIEQKFYIKEKDYFSEVVRLNLTAKEALSDYEAKVGK